MTPQKASLTLRVATTSTKPAKPLRKSGSSLEVVVLRPGGDSRRIVTADTRLAHPTASAVNQALFDGVPGGLAWLSSFSQMGSSMGTRGD